MFGYASSAVRQAKAGLRAFGADVDLSFLLAVYHQFVISIKRIVSVQHEEATLALSRTLES